MRGRRATKLTEMLAYLRCLHSYHTPAHSLRTSNTNLLSVRRVHTTFASRGFSVAAPSVWTSLPAGIRACSLPHTFHRLLKPTVSIRPSVHPSGSHKCLRFGLWSTLCTIGLKDFIYLLTYLLTKWRNSRTDLRHQLNGSGQTAVPVVPQWWVTSKCQLGIRLKVDVVGTQSDKPRDQ